MEQVKRLHSAILLNYDDRKKQKKNIETVDTNKFLFSDITTDCITNFEHLSNELFYELFEYLDHHHAFQGFYSLNKRFQNLFIHFNLPIKINISSISKSIFRNYSKYIIEPHINQIKSVRLSNPLATDMSSLIFSMMTNMNQLTTLIIHNIESNYVDKLVYYAHQLPLLSSLTITFNGSIDDQSSFYENIFDLSALKYCQLLVESSNGRPHLRSATNKFSPIEHLVINNEVWLCELDSLLSYVPQLRRLAIGNFARHGVRQIRNKSTSLNNLMNVSFKLNSDSVNFGQFEAMMADLFHQVQILRITVSTNNFLGPVAEYSNGDRWEQLISTSLLNLRIFDFQHHYLVLGPGAYQIIYDIHLHRFHSSFWKKRQWFFEYRYAREKYNDTAIFFSTNPYRRKFYSLHEQLYKDIDSNDYENNLESVQQLYIHNLNAIKQFTSHFSNVTEVILPESCVARRDSLMTNLSRIIPIRQLTQLTINCRRYPFERVVELITFTPNMHTLKLESVVLYGTNSYSIQQSENFILASKINTITNLTIEQECTLDKIQLLTKLFSRLEHFTINLLKQDLESSLRYLLSKINNHRYLSLLCIEKPYQNLQTNVETLIRLENLLDEYTLKMIHVKLYLWWSN